MVQTIVQPMERRQALVVKYLISLGGLVAGRLKQGY